MDDAALLKEYATHRSETAFEALVSRHGPLVYSAAMRQVRDPHLAEEVSQAVFVILAKKAGSLGDRTLLSGWLFKATRYVALAQNRTAARRRHYEQESCMQPESPLADTDPLWEQISPLLDEALTRLGEKDRQAVLMRFFENKSMAEVGSSIGIGEDAARMRVHRALEKLRIFFVKRGVLSTSAIIAGVISANSVQAAPAALARTITVAAVAKGATGGSSVALVKGGLKLMAWTKAKTATVIAVAALLTSGASVVTIDAVRVALYPGIQGTWEGVMLLDDPGVPNGAAPKCHVVLKLVKRFGGYTATTDWIEMGRKDVPMGKVIYDYPSLTIQRNARDTWNFKVNGEATQMILDHSVNILQPDPVLFTRTTTPDPVPDPLAEQDFAPRPGSDLQGYWEGQIGTGPDAMPVDLKIAEGPDGTFRAEADSPMQGADGEPANMTYTRPGVKFMLASGEGMFQGQINGANTEISGLWTQDGQSSPATIKRADYQAEHAQDAEKNYSYTSANDLQGHWTGTWIVPFPTRKVPIRMALDIAKLPDGTYSAMIADVDQFGYDAPIPASSFQFSPPELHAEWKWAVKGYGSANNVVPSYDGRFENGKIVGVWNQSGGSFPLVFKRTR